jgi:hypothetical protein
MMNFYKPFIYAIGLSLACGVTTMYAAKDGAQPAAQTVLALSDDLVREFSALDPAQAELVKKYVKELTNQVKDATQEKRSIFSAARAGYTVLKFPQFCINSIAKISNFADTIISMKTLVHSKDFLVRVIRVMILVAAIVVIAEGALWGASVATFKWFGLAYNFTATNYLASGMNWVMQLFMTNLGLPIKEYLFSGALQEAVANVLSRIQVLMQGAVREGAAAAAGVGLAAGEGAIVGAGQAIIQNPIAATKIGLGLGMFNFVTGTLPVLAVAFMTKKLIG